MYIIRVIDARSGNAFDLCRVGSNPEAIAVALRQKTFKVGDRNMRTYSAIEIVDAEAAK